jgi:hypothetical protein
MQWFRTTPHVIRMLVALFLVAQFAGVVSSPLTQSHAAAGAAAHAIYHHDMDHRAGGYGHNECAYPDAGACEDQGDYCCALHAFFVGILPPATAVQNMQSASEPLVPAVNQVVLGLGPNRLDRPPRPLP